MARGPEASVSFDISEEVKAHVEAEIAKAQAEFDRLRQERDEARQAARFILDDLAGYRKSNRDTWERQYAWLKEKDGTG